MMVPTSLDDWNYDAINELVGQGYFETDNFDFKYTFKEKDPNSHERLVNTICAFANTTGGFLVFGVRRDTNGSYTIEGIEGYDNLAKEFGDQIKGASPTVYFVPKNPPIKIKGTSKVLPVFYIPQSINRPHMNEKSRFYYRTNSGNELMSYEQVREAFLSYEQREQKLRLLYTELLYNKEIADIIRKRSTEASTEISLSYFEVDVILRLLADIYPIIAKDQELVDVILRVRYDLSTTNTSIKFALSKLPLPIINTTDVIKKHNRNITDSINNYIIPNVDKAISILRQRYSIESSS